MTYTIKAKDLFEEAVYSNWPAPYRYDGELPAAALESVCPGCYDTAIADGDGVVNIDSLAYITGVRWWTVIEDGFLNSYKLVETDVSAYVALNTVAGLLATGSGIYMYVESTQAFDENANINEVNQYLVGTGVSINEPTITHTELNSTEMEIVFALDSREVLQLLDLYAVPTTADDLEADFETGIRERAEKLSLMTIDVAYSFKKISPPDLSTSLSAFASGKEEGTEGISVSAAKSGY